MGLLVWAYNPLILTIDPNFQRDIQIGLKVGLKKRHRCFFRFLIPAIQIPWNPAGCPGLQVVPKMEMFPVEGELISGQALKKSGLWTICKFEGGGVDFCHLLKFPDIPKENGDLVSREPPHYSKLFWKKHVELWHSSKIPSTAPETPGLEDGPFLFGARASWQVILLMEEIRRKPTWDV